MFCSQDEKIMTSWSVRRTRTPDSSRGRMIFLIPERSSSLAILVPSYISLQKTRNHQAHILIVKVTRIWAFQKSYTRSHAKNILQLKSVFYFACPYIFTMIDNWELPQTCKTINSKLDKNCLSGQYVILNHYTSKTKKRPLFLSHFIHNGT